MKLKPLAEQVVVITGASSGIGLATARTAARRGAKVMLVSRDEHVLEKICREIEAEGGAAGFVAADVGSAREMDEVAERTVERFGRIDTWVNDAGVAIYGKLTETPLDEHKRLFQTNYFGVVNGCTAAIRHMRERGGALITVGSIASELPTPMMGAYSASKHAVKAYVEALRAELRADGVPISVTLIKPSGIDTPIAQRAANHEEGEASVPPPIYHPQLVADAILHAAEHPIREVTVGGGGRLQVLLGAHFPRLVELMTPVLAPVIFDRSRPKTAGNALFEPFADGRERSGEHLARRTSLYTAARLHPATTAAIATGAAALLALARKRRRRWVAP